MAYLTVMGQVGQRDHRNRHSRYAFPLLLNASLRNVMKLSGQRHKNQLSYPK